MRVLPLWPHLTPFNSLRPHLQIPDTGGWGFTVWILGEHKHSVHNTKCLRIVRDNFSSVITAVMTSNCTSKIALLSSTCPSVVFWGCPSLCVIYYMAKLSRLGAEFSLFHTCIVFLRCLPGAMLPPPLTGLRELSSQWAGWPDCASSTHRVLLKTASPMEMQLSRVWSASAENSV